MTVIQLIHPEASDCEIDLDLVVWVQVPDGFEIEIVSDDWRQLGTVSHDHTGPGPVPGTDFIIRPTRTMMPATAEYIEANGEVNQ